MLRIRLRRVGKKKQPAYRIVVADSHSPRDGAFVESIGYYHPLDNPSTIVIDDARAKHWLEKGAMPSDRVAKLFKIQGLAELPPKLVKRMELGDQRAKDAAAAKASAKAEEAEAKAEAPTEAAPAPEAAAEAEAAAEEPAAEAEAPAEEPAAEAKAPAEEPAAEAEAPAEATAEAETPAEEAGAEEKSE
jgi:small subunit ribosomal protein S16